MTGIIFDIKEFTVHDGPGSRITVFLKGCPLRCRWCHNPEGLSAAPQLMYRENLCSHCGRCRTSCEHLDCRGFDRCLHACVNGCLSVAGKTVEAKQLARQLLQNGDMLQLMSGGITVSGGEPLLQPDFVVALAKSLGPIHKALQTSGYAEPEIYRQVVENFDYVLQDIKLADRDAHRHFTGASNEKILENIRWLKKSGKEFVFRVPLIPGITDTPENLTAIARITGNHKVELMPYNALAGAKYSMVGMKYSLEAGTALTQDPQKYFENAVVLR